MNATVTAKGMAKGMATVTAVARLKTGFAINHLQVAAHSAREAYKIEQANAGKPFGEWFDEMMRLVPVSVVMAGAALEAAANEALQDILDGSTSLPLTGGRKALLTDLKNEQSGNATNKYRRLALIMDKEPQLGKRPWQNAKVLVEFRNHFMHFKPSWDSDSVHNGDLVKLLKAKVPVVDAYKRNFLFPYGFMTYGCAKWAVQTVLEFSSDFTKLLGVTDKFTLPGLDFKLP